MYLAVAFLILILLLTLYLLPALIAGLRSHRNFAAILALNLFLGWSILGWIVSLVWALTSDPLIIVDPRSSWGDVK